MKTKVKDTPPKEDNRAKDQAKTGQKCHCKPGQQRDKCPDCEGTGQRVDFAAIRARKNPAAVALGRKGGKANTPAQNTARRENGRKGGRPLKYTALFAALDTLLEMHGQAVFVCDDCDVKEARAAVENVVECLKKLRAPKP